MSQKVLWSQFEEGARKNKIPPLQAWLWGWRNYDLIDNSPYERWEFIRNAGLLAIPSLAKGDYNPWFEDCCRVYAAASYIAAMGCSNSGKTWSFHTLAFLDYMSDPRHTQGIFTTTSQQGLETRMWPILSAHYRGLKPAGWKITHNPRKTIMSSADDTKHVLRAVAIEERANKNMIVDNIIGAHSDRVIWIVDEATSSPAAIFDAWKNLAGGTTHRRFILLGNPIDQLDSLGSFCRPVAGWDSIHSDVDRWEFQFQNEKGIGMHFNGEKSPNLKQTRHKDGSSRWSWLFGHADFERHAADKEKEPLGYARFCQGWFADSSLIPKVMTMAHLDQGGVTRDVTFYGGTQVFAALDPAYGGDRPALKIFKMGIDAESMINVMKQIGNYTIPLRPGKLVGQEIGEYVMKKSKEFGFKVIGIDTTTDNSAPAEYIRLNSDLQVIDVNFGGKASDLDVSPSDTTKCCDKYVNKVTELWFTIRYVLHQIRGLDKETCIELCSRYFDRTGKPEKMVVETKKKMKERTRGKSPDLADCVAIGVQVFRHLGGFDIVGAFNSQEDWKKLAKRKGQIYSSEHAYGYQN